MFVRVNAVIFVVRSANEVGSCACRRQCCLLDIGTGRYLGHSMATSPEDFEKSKHESRVYKLVCGYPVEGTEGYYRCSRSLNQRILEEGGSCERSQVHSLPYFTPTCAMNSTILVLWVTPPTHSRFSLPTAYLIRFQACRYNHACWYYCETLEETASKTARLNNSFYNSPELASRAHCYKHATRSDILTCMIVN